jgi:hypothetical protein
MRLARIVKWENQWGNFPRSSPVSVDVFDVSVLRRSAIFSFASQPIRHGRFLLLSSINPKEYVRPCEAASKSGKEIERCVISTFQVAESMGFQGRHSLVGNTCCELAIEKGLQVAPGPMSPAISSRRSENRKYLCFRIRKSICAIRAMTPEVRHFITEVLRVP